ncbi:MAG: MerR family transcriptional regulator [Clostridiales Family XIII bacterium]|nr:MerR family transcriptional regulator [Clostridiales Family XIII bacterium]
MLSIKDFSKLTGIKQSTLRYYDDLGLFSPAKRGDNSYRYYSPHQIITINSINLLHELDMPIRSISEIQRNRTPERVLEVLSEKESELEAELSKIERSYNVIKTLRRLIGIGLTVDDNAIEIRHMDELPIVIGPRNDFRDSLYFYDAFLRFCAESKQYRIDLRFPVGGLFEDFDTFKEHPGEPCNFFSVDPSGIDKKQPGKYLVAYTRGYYGNTGDMTERVKRYLDENKLTPAGPVYNIFLLDELSIKEQDQYLMQFSMRVE